MRPKPRKPWELSETTGCRFTIGDLAKGHYCCVCHRQIPRGEMYAVQDNIWIFVTRPEESELMMHVACLEMRLGRVLTRRDFKRCPVNDDPEDTQCHPPILRDRLRRKP